MNLFLRYGIDRAARWMVQHPRVTVAIVLLYVLSPIDFFPEAFVGPAGFVDDIFAMLLPLVARAYVRRHDQAILPPSRPS